MDSETRRPNIPLERMETAEVLACVEPFMSARPAEIEALARAAVRVRKPGGGAILLEGEPADGLYVLLRGRVNLVRVAGGGRDLILSTLGPGDTFGEVAAFCGGTMSTTATTPIHCELLRIPPEALVEHLRREPETALRLMRMQHERLREIESVASGLALCDVEERLRRTLARLAKRQGRRVAADAGWILAPVPTQSELARMVGSCRETVSRTLSVLARTGQVTSSGRRMIVNDDLISRYV
ncbi:MAG: Crp/Fnr family transcriptional regulator [Nannocystis sp.]|jgi:CRP-like cAMP-binding protein|nr:Crp/Fnr family transcriptional regulator [Nannocystis sp.]